MKHYNFNLKCLFFTGLLTTILFSSCSTDELEDIRPSAAPENIQLNEKYGANNYGADVNIAMGNPSGARPDSYFYWNYLMKKSQYALSYHQKRGTPNWVSWHLDPTWLGSASRSNDFNADYSLPSNWYKVTSDDYKYTGFDRGHMCPSADRTYSSTDNSSTFYMTNIIPQSPDNNQGPWASLEAYCRQLLNYGYELYIISGSYGTGGSGSNGYYTTISGGKVTVPNRIWKVIVVLPLGSNDVARVNTSTRVIAVDIPNKQGIRYTNWTAYKTTVDAIESRMGYDLLSNVPTSIQSHIESKVD